MSDNKDIYNTDRETRQFESGKEQEAKFHLEQAAAALQPVMGRHLGSYTVHIYARDMTGEIIFKNQNQLRIDGKPGDVTEAIVSKSFDELRSSLMALFGRKKR